MIYTKLMMVDPSFLFCRLVTIGLNRYTWPELEVVFCYLNIESFATSWLQSCMLLILDMNAVILHEDDDVRGHSAGKMMGSFFSTAACTPAAAAGSRRRGGGSPFRSGAASGSPEHYSTVQYSTTL